MSKTKYRTLFMILGKFSDILHCSLLLRNKHFPRIMLLFPPLGRRLQSTTGGRICLIQAEIWISLQDNPCSPCLIGAATYWVSSWKSTLPVGCFSFLIQQQYSCIIILETSIVCGFPDILQSSAQKVQENRTRRKVLKVAKGVS